MAVGKAPDTGWFQATASPAAVSATSVPCGHGVALISGSEFSVGNRVTITHKTGAVTDGFPVPANTVFPIPPGMWPVGVRPDLNSLYAVAAGNVDVWLIYPAQ